MAMPEEKLAKSKCIMCGSMIEKANLGNLCNPCKDRIGGIKSRSVKPKKIMAKS